MQGLRGSARGHDVGGRPRSPTGSGSVGVVALGYRRGPCSNGVYLVLALPPPAATWATRLAGRTPLAAITSTSARPYTA